MSQLSLPQSRVPGTLPLFYTTLVEAPRRIFWQDQPQNILCRLVFGIPPERWYTLPDFHLEAANRQRLYARTNAARSRNPIWLADRNRRILCPECSMRGSV